MEKNSLVVEEIELEPNTLPKELTIAIFQLKSPFWDEFTKSIDPTDSGNILIQDEENLKIYEERIEKINNILAELEAQNSKRKEKINLIIFPEYSYPPELIEETRQFANRNQIILIGGYYTRDERASACFVLLPEGWAQSSSYKINKNSTSTLDKDFLDTQTEKKLLKINWKPNGGTEIGCIQIFICKDFLCYTGIEQVRQNPKCIYLTKPGIIVVPMCSPKTKHFIDEAERLLREPSEECARKNIITILCNCTDTKERLESSSAIAGGSRIITLLDEIIEERNSVLEKGLEGFLLAKVNPFAPILKPTTKCSGPNAVLQKLSKIRIDQKCKFVYETKENMGIIINPFMFKEINLKKVYAFISLKDYGKFKENIKNLTKDLSEQSIGVYGIWGYHDLLVESYEYTSSIELIKQNIQIRLWPLLRSDFFLKDLSIGIAKVKHSLKVRNEEMFTEKNYGIQKYLQKHCTLDYNPELKKFLHTIVIGRDLSFRIIDHYIQENICIPTKYGLSDITDEEKESGKMEFLVLIQVEKKDNKAIETKEQLFQRNALNDFIQDTRIRTIEVLESSGEALVNANYLFHIVGDLTDLREIVLDEILANKYPDILCKTQVILPSEKLLENYFPALNEPQNDDANEEKLNALIVEYLKLLTWESPVFDVLTLKRVDCNISKILFRTFDIFRELNERHYKRELSEANNEVLKYIFSISSIIEKFEAEKLDDNAINDFHIQSSPFLNKLGKRVEKCIKEPAKRIIKELGITNEEFNEIINKAAIAKSPQISSRFNFQKLEIGPSLLSLNLLIKLLYDDPEWQSKFIKQYQNKVGAILNTQDFDRKCYYLKTIGENYKKYFEILDKHDPELTKDYLAKFSNLRNFASHDVDIVDFDKKDILIMPKIILEVCKHCLEIHDDLFR
jgi:hypothetical protein